MIPDEQPGSGSPATDATDQWAAVHAETTGADKKKIAQALPGVFPEPVDDAAEGEGDDGGS